MEAVWADMALTELPSWVTKAPPNWGTAARGKLSANNWRVICTIHLPITLIRLWGRDDLPGVWKAKLENFMDLVRAVQIANLRSISRKEVELYEHYIFRYMTSFKSLYKLAKVKPIHHAALHYGDVLRGFGPAHTHNAAFYERHIHSMQSKNHNMKLGLSFVSRSNFVSALLPFQPGELESTFMRSSMREANLQALLSDDSQVRSHVGNLVEVYNTILAEDVRGTRLAHMIDAVHLTQQTPDFTYNRKSVHESSLPDAILAAFIQFLDFKHTELRTKNATEGPSNGFASTKTKFLTLNKFSLRGVQYSTATSRVHDSHVFFRSPLLEISKPPPHPDPTSGQITHIFLYSHVPVSSSPASPSQPDYSSVYVCVRPYAPLRPSPELNKIDQMYRRFGFTGGFLCQKEFSPPVIIEPSHIISHVAVTPISGHEVVHVLPMDRVSFSIFLEQKDKTRDFQLLAHADFLRGHRRHRSR